MIWGGLAFGVAMGVFLRLWTGSGYYGFHGGFFCAFAFAAGLRTFLGVELPSLPPARSQRDDTFASDESIVHAGPANHFMGMEAVGGKLFLTNHRLRFRAHALNVQRHDTSYPLGDIVSVTPTRTLGLVPNGIRIELADGRREKFVVSARSEWLDALMLMQARSGSCS